MQVIITNRAKQNLNSIFKFIAKDSLKYAIETDKNIRINIRRLELFPYIGRYVLEFPDKQLRELIYKSYRIIYDISEENNTVYIHFIVHCKKNFKSIYNSYFKNI